MAKNYWKIASISICTRHPLIFVCFSDVFLVNY